MEAPLRELTPPSTTVQVWHTGICGRASRTLQDMSRHARSAPMLSPGPQDDLTVIQQLRNELLSLCAFMLKLNAVTPSRPPPLPYLVALYNKSDVERVRNSVTVSDDHILACTRARFCKRMPWPAGSRCRRRLFACP